MGADSAPAEKLDVTGNIKVSGTVDGVDIAARDHAKYLNSEAIAAVEGEATLDLAGDVTIAANKSLTVDTSTLFVDGVNHRVGIGLTGPRTTLELATGNSAFIAQKSGSTGFSISSYWPSLALNMWHTGAEWKALGAGYVGLWNQNPGTGKMVFGTSLAAAGAGDLLGANPVGADMEIAPGGFVTLINTTTSAWIQSLRLKAANMAADNMLYFSIGQWPSNYNECALGFKYVGAGSTSNRMDFWFYGLPALLSLEATGRVGIGKVGGMAAMLHIDQAASGAAIPVLTLDQADISDGFINFIGSDRGIIAAATASLKSVRVELGGVVYRLALYVDA